MVRASSVAELTPNSAVGSKANAVGIDPPMGLIQVASRKLRSAIHKARTERFYVLDSEPHRVEARVPIEFQCVERIPDEVIPQICRLTGRTLDWQHRCELGHRCVLTRHEGELVGAIWVSLGVWVIGSEKTAGRLAPDVAFIYDGFVSETMRGQRIASVRLAYVFDEMKRHGFERNLTTVEDDNIPSIKSVATVGYRTTENLVTLHRRFMFFRSIEGGPPADVLPN